jgi:glycosyltransferase involved in cell wall biosynthesis
MSKHENVLFLQKWHSLSGGVERVNVNLSQAFEMQGINSLFYILNTTGIKEAGYNKLKSERNAIAAPQNTSTLNKLKHLIHIIEEQSVSAIISATETANLYAFICKLRFPKLRVIYTRHCAFDVSDQKLSPLKIKMLYNLYALSGGTIGAVSESLKQEIQASLAVRKSYAKFLPNAVFDKKIDELASINTDNSDYAPYFVAIGRLVEQKGFDTLIASYAAALKMTPNLPNLVIVGIGELKDKLIKQMRKENIEAKVFFHGFTDNPYFLLKNAEAFLLSSRHEGMPTVLVEAIYLKIPVIAFDCPTGPSELIKDSVSGILVENQSIEGFTRALLDYKKLQSDYDNSSVKQFSFDNVENTYLHALRN